MIKGIVFDMDGVLADTELFYQKRREAYLRQKHYTPKNDMNFIGSNEIAIWEALVPDDAELRCQMMTEYREYRAAHPEPYKELVDPQVKPLFEILKRCGIKIGIASSSDPDSICKMMEAANVTLLVDFYISGTNCQAHKPDPEIYQKSLEVMGLTKESAFAVEDSHTGIAAARNAGLKVYALKPRHGERIDQSGATKVIEELFDILHLIW